uniref:Uncharacterized protein n=1 Tax=Leersia perrieri TaxID=77586 RepID=A0A0D9VS35_9ORYZ
MMRHDQAPDDISLLHPLSLLGAQRSPLRCCSPCQSLWSPSSSTPCLLHCQKASTPTASTMGSTMPAPSLATSAKSLPNLSVRMIRTRWMARSRWPRVRSWRTSSVAMDLRARRGRRAMAMLFLCVRGRKEEENASCLCELMGKSA